MNTWLCGWSLDDVKQKTPSELFISTSLTCYWASVCSPQSEWEALEIIEHKWALENVEDELMSRDLNFGTFFSQDVKTAMF